MVGIKTTGEQISILCHNGTIFDKLRGKTGLAIKRHVGVYVYMYAYVWICLLMCLYIHVHMYP